MWTALSFFPAVQLSLNVDTSKDTLIGRGRLLVTLDLDLQPHVLIMTDAEIAYPTYFFGLSDEW